MVSDPRCPHCSGKVSATASWCMHCGEDFEDPVDADTGRPVEGRGDHGIASDALTGSQSGQTLVGIMLAVVALVTLPWASPPGVTLFYLVAVVGVGLYASKQATTADAIRSGGTALAVTPIALWLLSAVTGGFGVASPFGLFRPFVYALFVGSIARRIADAT